jgi:hypothetical protein
MKTEELENEICLKLEKEIDEKINQKVKNQFAWIKILLAFILSLLIALIVIIINLTIDVRSISKEIPVIKEVVATRKQLNRINQSYEIQTRYIEALNSSNAEKLKEINIQFQKLRQEILSEKNDWEEPTRGSIIGEDKNFK